MNLIPISKYRTQIMGIATIFITLCHTTFSISGMGKELYSIFISRFMQCGVDIFLLVSGLGCFYSFANNPSVGGFYKKRIIRLFIPFTVYVLFHSLILLLLKNGSVADFLYNFSIVPFFISGNLSCWFIGAIIVLYAIFPLLYKLVTHSHYLTFFITGCILFIVLIPFWRLLPNNIQVIREIFLVRISVFMIGIVIGDCLYNHKLQFINHKIIIFTFFISFILFIINVVYNTNDTWIYSRALFLPISTSVVVLISNLFDKIKLEKRKYNSFFIFWGNISLEMYLIFERALRLTSDYLPRPRAIFSLLSEQIISVIVNVLAITIAVLVSVILSKISRLIIKRVSKFI